MGLRFFVDHCVPASIIQSLRNANHDVLLLKEHLPTDSSDEEVILKAQQCHAVLVSLNGDFADIIRFPPANYKGIISVQLKNHPEVIPALLQRLQDYLSSNSDMSHYQGKLFIVEVHRIRICS
jgi:predicted nuclease of predicted toxin-antitoxin system